MRYPLPLPPSVRACLRARIAAAMHAFISCRTRMIYSQRSIERSTGMEQLLYHGSSAVIEKPVFGAGNPHNDYGLAFYCTR